MRIGQRGQDAPGSVGDSVLDCLGDINRGNFPLTTHLKQNLDNLNEKISEGRFRDVYRYNDLVIKKPKPYIIKRFRSIEVRIPTALYTLVNYAIRDFNKYEYKQYQSIVSKIPSDLHKCFAKVHKPIKNKRTSYSINQLVIDHGGQISKTLSEHGKVKDKQFWSLIAELEKQFSENRIFYFSVGSPNICVNRQADGRLIPVLIDYKRSGIRTFWRQLPLFLPYFSRQKMRRRFQKLREQFKDCERSV